MANYYLDHGAYPAYAAVPTWNTAQDGDGKATGLATPAVASILLNAQPSAGNLLSICGVSFGATSGGTHNYTIGGTLTATADNIAAAINAATTNVAAGVATGTPQVRNLLYARGPTNGAAANTVEIMTRVGSADFNNATNAANWAITQSGWGTAPTFTQWAGGASGVWGYLVNTASIWPSGVAAFGYGAWKTGANAQPLHGPSTLSVLADQIFVRTRGQTITVPVNTSVAMVRDGANYIYDDGAGTVAAWSGDTGALTLAMSASGSSSIQRTQVGVKVCERAMTYGRYVVQMDAGAGNTTWFSSPDNTGEYLAENIRFVSLGSYTTTPSWVRIGSGSKATFRGCKLELPGNYTNVSTLVNIYASSNIELCFDGCELVFTGLLTSPTAPFISPGSSTNNKYVVRNCKVTGSPAPMKLFGLSSPTASTDFVLIGDSCEGFDVPATLCGFGALGKTTPVEQQYMLLYNIGAKQGYTFESSMGYVQWWSGQDYPTLSALLDDGDSWSLRYRWVSSTTAGISPARPFTIWRTSKRALSAGLQTVTIELLLDPSYAAAVTKSHLGVEVSYVSNVTSSRKVAHSVEATTENGIASSTASWSLGSTYNGYTKAKVTVTLPDAIKADSRVDVALRAYRPAPTADQYLFLDPEPALS